MGAVTSQAFERAVQPRREAEVIVRGKFRGEIYPDACGDFRWRVRAPSGRVVVGSTRGYEDRDVCVRTFAMLCRLVEVEHLVEQPEPFGPLR
ncbi:MAG TPA: hypothetical protein VJP45_07340 [Candidatus Limnocylindria bacterium]|nr:hypothetical protein [Candidatus Limnocylindria bacterium]